MQIVDQELRLHVEKTLIMRDRLDVGPEGLVVVEIADVMAEERMTSPAHRERRLQLAAQGERRCAAGDRQGDRSWRIAPRAANRQLDPGDEPRHRVVATEMNRPVVHEEEIGDPRQAFERIAVLVGDRLVGSIAAGHHQGNAVQLAEEQVVQGGIRQHHAQPGIARRDSRGHASVRPSRATGRWAGGVRGAAIPPRARPRRSRGPRRDPPP